MLLIPKEYEVENLILFCIEKNIASLSDLKDSTKLSHTDLPMIFNIIDLKNYIETQEHKIFEKELSKNGK